MTNYHMFVILSQNELQSEHMYSTAVGLQHKLLNVHNTHACIYNLCDIDDLVTAYSHQFPITVPT